MSSVRQSGDMKPGPGHSGRHGVHALVLVALTLAAFLPALGAGFINLDDPKYVTENPRVRGGWSLDNAVHALGSFDTANWHPLTWASHLTDVTLFGLDPVAHHAMSLALHTLAAVLLLLALQAMTGRPWASLLAAGLFALHPLRVESVAWVAERKDVLAGLLATATLLLHVRHARRPGRGRLAAVIGAFSLGLMAKPTLVPLPLLLLLLDWWPLGRLRPKTPAGTPGRGQPGIRLLLEKTPLLALSGAAAVVTLLAQRQGGALAPMEIFPLQSRVLNALSAYASYLGSTLWPAGLAPFYPHQGAGLTVAAAVPAIALLAGVGAVAWGLRGHRPWLLCGWLWYLVALLPMIGLVQVGLQGMADRYTYLPSIGLALTAAWEILPGRSGAVRAGAVRAAAAAVVLGALALLAARQAGFWRDTETLFMRAVQLDPANYLAYGQLGLEALERGEHERAVALLSRAYAARPEYLAGRYNLGLALRAAGRKEEALAHVSAFLGARPREANALIVRGMLLAELGRHREALGEFDAVLAARPDDPQIHALRGYSLGQIGDSTAAVDAYRRAAALDPGGAAIRFNLAQELRRLGRMREAMAEYEIAVRLDPRDAEALNALGAMLVERGRPQEALALLEEAVRLAPDLAAARANLARLRTALAQRRPPARPADGR